jgi:hypothetical protein
MGGKHLLVTGLSGTPGPRLAQRARARAAGWRRFPFGCRDFSPGRQLALPRRRG